MTRNLLIFIIGISIFSSCIESQNKFSKIPPGIWRGVLYMNPNALVSGVDKDEITTNPDNSEQLPFNFEVVYDNDEDFHLLIHNADERIKVDDIVFGRDRATAKDTLQIRFTEYDTYLSLVYEEKVMEGYWHVNYKDNYRIKFKAVHGDSSRFKKEILPSNINVDGKWSVRFENDTEDEYPAIGLFDQKGDNITGTFLTETGDYRFLEGKVSGEKMFLSCFDGAHAFLFEGKELNDNEITGFFKSGIHYTAPFIAVKDDSISLSDPFTLNEVVASDNKMEFSFPNSEGKIINLTDPQYEGKSKIIEIMGTWCPNCMDATTFLKDFKNTEEGSNIELISIAFERYNDDAKNLAQIKKYRKKMNLPWEILLGGNYKKSEASKAIPQLDKIISYPTLIFLDKDNVIKDVYTGFSGPATPDFEKFKTKFSEIIKEL